MKAASLNDLKKELMEIETPQLIELCLKVTKFKKENKELLTYLLFEASNEQKYIQNIKSKIDELFEDVPKVNLYLTYKVLRKIQRTSNKYIKYSGIRQTEVEINLYLCEKIKKSGIKIHHSNAIANMVEQLIKKITKSISTLHEDLQYDFTQELERFQL